MPQQIPAKDHPWRRGWQRSEPKKEVKKVKPLRIFITEISENWEKVEVITTAYGKSGRFTLGNLPQKKQAAWLAGILRRNYG